MSKQTVQNVRVGQLAGVKLTIQTIHNEGLQESVSIQNDGTVAQPMSGWILADLRGQRFYAFPDNLIFLPGLTVIIHSGRRAQDRVRGGQVGRINLYWTNDQVWNNHGDSAFLFDANGVEIDHYAYPHDRVRGSSAAPRKLLVQRPEGYQIIDAPAPRLGRAGRHTNPSAI